MKKILHVSPPLLPARLGCFEQLLGWLHRRSRSYPGTPPTGIRMPRKTPRSTTEPSRPTCFFFGTSTVTTVASGATFTDGKALFELVADGEGKVRILMHETRFAAEMPALEMEIPGISYSGEEKNHRLERRLGHTGNQGHALRQIRNHQSHGKRRQQVLNDYLHLCGSFRCKLSGTPDYRKNKIFS